MRAHNAIRSGLLLVGLFVLGDLAQGQDTPAPDPEPTHESPRTIYDFMERATKKNDYKAIMRCLSPESADRLTVQIGMVAATSRALALADDAEMKAIGVGFEKVLVKYGFTKEEMTKLETVTGLEDKKIIKRLVAPVKDKPAFVRDVMLLVGKLDPDKSKPDESKPNDSVLKDIKVTGDKARGVVVTKEKGKKKSEPIDFVKIGGKWYIVESKFVTTESKASPPSRKAK